MATLSRPISPRTGSVATPVAAAVLSRAAAAATGSTPSAASMLSIMWPACDALLNCHHVTVPLTGTLFGVEALDTVLGKAVALLRAFGPADSVLPLAELVRRTGLPKGTVHRVAG